MRGDQKASKQCSVRGVSGVGRTVEGVGHAHEPLVGVR